MTSTLTLILSLAFIQTPFFSWCRVWRLGYVYCKMNTFLSYVTVPASVFTLLAITIDRRKVCPMRQDLFDGVGGGEEGERE